LQRLLFRPRPLDAAVVEVRVVARLLPLVAHPEARLLPVLLPVAQVVEVRVAQFRQFLAAGLRPLQPADAEALRLR
jgi:hypothetical protein